MNPRSSARFAPLALIIITTSLSSIRTLVPLWENYWSAALRQSQKAVEKGRRGAGILLVLAKCFWPTFLLGALYQLVYALLQFASPQILGLIINFVQNPDDTYNWQGYLYTALFAVVAFSSAIADSSYWYNMRLVGLRLRTALSSTIYRKSLKLSNASRRAQNGEYNAVFSLLQTDAQLYCRTLFPFLYKILVLAGAPVVEDLLKSLTILVVLCTFLSCLLY